MKNQINPGAPIQQGLNGYFDKDQHRAIDMRLNGSHDACLYFTDSYLNKPAVRLHPDAQIKNRVGL